MTRISCVLARAVRAALVVVVVAPAMAAAPDGGSAKPFTPEQLEQVVAPVALYPDPLLAQVLMASTYPLEVVQAARFAKTNPGLEGDPLNEALKQQGWDDSVKSLVTFPQVLTMMNDKLDWMQKLGDAVLAQQKDVMDAVQRLRAKAQAEGNLTSTPQQKVATEPAEAASAPAALPQQQAQQAQAPPQAPAQPTIITIEPTNPQVVYVPTYNPSTVYGAWPYPAYPPYYWYPPGYGAATAAISFGVGMAVGAALWSGCDWHHGDVDIDVDRHTSFTNNVNRSDQVRASRTNVQGGTRQGWQHDPEHRKGVQYRDQATQQRFNRADLPDAGSREAFRGRAEQGRQDLARGGADQAKGARSREGGLSGAGGGGTRGGRESHQGAAGASPRVSQARDAGAFDGLGQGRNVQAQSNRGQASLGSARAGGWSGGRATAGGGSHGGGGARGGRR